MLAAPNNCRGVRAQRPYGKDYRGSGVVPLRQQQTLGKLAE